MATSLPFTRFDQMVEALGGKGVQVTEPERAPPRARARASGSDEVCVHQRGAGPRRLPPRRPGLDGHLIDAESPWTLSLGGRGQGEGGRPEITFLAPHIRIAGGVRAILTYADRLAGRGHDVTVVVPARRPWRARGGAISRGRGPDWIPGFRAARALGGARGIPARLPDGRRAHRHRVAVGRRRRAGARARAARKFYLVQHYESLYHGDAARVDATYALPLKKIVISTWLQDIMRERFGSAAEVLVTPVDRDLFHPVPGARSDDALRVLMLHHDYAWKGVREGLEAVARGQGAAPRSPAGGLRRQAPARGAAATTSSTRTCLRSASRGSTAGCPIYLCPSWDEGLGMPPMEAMACGAALVTFDNGGCRDYALDGETALVAPRRDVAALARALERLVTDAALRERLARQGQAFVTSRFDWDRARSGSRASSARPGPARVYFCRAGPTARVRIERTYVISAPKRRIIDA